MRGCNPTPTAADKRRFELFHQIGCIACWKEGIKGEPPEIHHIHQGDHSQTLPLCPWHHRGQRIGAGDIFKGPSLAKSKRAFVARYGTEESLQLFVNELVGYLQ